MNAPLNHSAPHDIEQTKYYLALLDSEATAFSFQCFDDSDQAGHVKNPALARHTTSGKEAAALYQRGAGVFVTVNETDLTGRKSENITRVRAVWHEDDSGHFGRFFPLEPSMIVESSPGKFHRYWLVEDSWPADDHGRADFAAVMERMVASYGSDKNAKDISRVLRAPGFLHRKDPAKPYMVRVAHISGQATGRRYTRAEIIAAFPAVEQEQQQRHQLRSASGEADKPHRALNEMALARLDTWVPALGLYRCRRTRNGFEAVATWRGSSTGRRDDKRKLNLKIMPDGIRDFGADQGYTPIDLVMAAQGVNLDAAFHYLATRVGFGETVFMPEGTSPLVPTTPGSKNNHNNAAAARITATPWVWVDPASIPRRQWLYKPMYIRAFVGLTAAAGGVGKSGLTIVEALAMASCRPLLGVEPEKQLKVWLYNGEDPKHEMDRRLAAALKFYRLTAADIGDRLFVDSGRDQPIVIAEQTRAGVTVYAPVVEQIIEEIIERKIDVMIVDPFVSSHRVEENDNVAIERVAKEWARIAEVTNCAIHLVHHARKTNGGPVTVEDGRGASALRDAVRMARALNVMTDKEAEEAEINDSDRLLKINAQYGKVNLTKRAGQKPGTRWTRCCLATALARLIPATRSAW